MELYREKVKEGGGVLINELACTDEQQHLQNPMRFCNVYTIS